MLFKIKNYPLYTYRNNEYVSLTDDVIVPVSQITDCLTQYKDRCHKTPTKLVGAIGDINITDIEWLIKGSTIGIFIIVDSKHLTELNSLNIFITFKISLTDTCSFTPHNIGYISSIHNIGSIKIK